MAGKSSIDQLLWEPNTFTMSTLTKIGDPIVVFDPITTEIQTTHVYEVKSKFSFDPLAYPFDSHDLTISLFFLVPISRISKGGTEDPAAHQHGDPDEQPEQIAHSTEQGFSIDSIRQRTFIYCFPFHGSVRSIYTVDKVFLDSDGMAATDDNSPPENPITKLLAGTNNQTCLFEPMAGHEITVRVVRKSAGFMIRLVLPVGLITLLSTAQVWMDLRYIGSRNQIVTLSMLTSFNMIGGTRLPSTNAVSWFELFGFVGVTVFMSIVAINILAHNIERKGRPHFARLWDKAARVILPLHFLFGVSCISLVSFTGGRAGGIVGGVFLYFSLMSLTIAAAIKWGKKAKHQDKIEAEHITNNQIKSTRREEESSTIARAFLTDISAGASKLKKAFSSRLMKKTDAEKEESLPTGAAVQAGDTGRRASVNSTRGSRFLSVVDGAVGGIQKGVLGAADKVQHKLREDEEKRRQERQKRRQEKQMQARPLRANNPLYGCHVSPNNPVFELAAELYSDGEESVGEEYRC
eukprot:TRINITY_DN35739_c0_g1_i1.p1 TRINITY_DN35739_c0_g1~~TRINITY_DN35739_c0_g1_i1.p1  ORF type:complete len:607 (+),score=39.16 TRINITY_DN35739_c0_g1_i1:264-1823(+)